MTNQTNLTDPLLTAEHWMEAGRAVAIATVIETWGSAPRPVGSHLVVDGDGNFEGSVSGGCVEGAVVTAAAEVIAAGKAQMLEFGVADETAWRAGLSDRFSGRRAYLPGRGSGRAAICCARRRRLSVWPLDGFRHE